MELNILSILAGIGVVSLICQWIAWQLRLPAILFLLTAGLILGPTTHWLQPDLLFSDLLFPIISLSVAVILFEGALTLDMREIKGHGIMVRNLLSTGLLINFLTGTIAARFALDMSWSIALLFGSIIVVTGPTVIMPLLRAVRPQANLANILKWEGIIIDPIGAILAVLVYEFIISSQHGDAVSKTFETFGLSVLVGLCVGAAGGYLLGEALRRLWIPKFLQNAGTLTFMIGMYALSNLLMHESGLLTVTVMGIWMANMRGVPVEDILEFKESLSVLLISALFILLAARIEFATLLSLGWGSLWVLLALMLVGRPLGVWMSGIGTALSWREKAFLSWIAPRGIVAGAVSALFAFRLQGKGFEDADLLVPLVFLVIISTVVLQSLTARPLAKRLNVKQPANDGFLIFGANNVARQIAKVLLARKVSVMVADTNWENIKLSRMEGLPVYYGNPVSEHAENNMELTGIGNMLAISPYKQLNTLATFHFLDLFGQGHVFGLSEGDEETRTRHKVPEKMLETRSLFGEGITYAKLASMQSKNATVKITQLSDEFTFAKYKEQHGNRLVPLFAIPPQGKITLFTATNELKPASGWEIISLIVPQSENQEAIRQ
jgi:NhaP-type Na+/H+ or K+/H+ antiporter